MSQSPIQSRIKLTALPEDVLEYIKTLENAVINLIDGSSQPDEIHAATGLPMEDCEQITKLYEAILKDRNWI